MLASQRCYHTESTTVHMANAPGRQPSLALDSDIASGIESVCKACHQVSKDGITNPLETSINVIPAILCCDFVRAR